MSNVYTKLPDALDEVDVIVAGGKPIPVSNNS